MHNGFRSLVDLSLQSAASFCLGGGKDLDDYNPYFTGSSGEVSTTEINLAADYCCSVQTNFF